MRWTGKGSVFDKLFDKVLLLSDMSCGTVVCV